MLISNCTEKLLELKGAIVKNIEIIEEKFFVDVVMEKRIHKCPNCMTETSKVHDYRTQLVKHTPATGRPVILRLRKRRYVCPHCNKRFFESVSFLPKYQRTSNTLWWYVLSELTSVSSMKSIAKRVSVSTHTIARILDSTSYGCTSLPDNLSIDEFRGNAGGEKFQCILTDPKKKQVLDILPSKKSADIYDYFSKFKNRKNVKTVTMDLSTYFKSIARACFPNAKIVADKFHAQRLAVYAFESVRKEEQRKFATSRIKYFKRSRTLLLKDKAKLTTAELEQVSLMLSISKPLAMAYHLKNLVYELFDAQDLHTAKKRMLAFQMAAQVSNLEAFHKVAATYTQWEKEILNIFTTGLSNGFTEGCNNKIKVIKRNAFGMHDYERFRKRNLHQMSN